MTFPRSVGQIPIYYAHTNTGRPYVEGQSSKFKSDYLDISNAPLYSFGYGLSYTTFSYGDIRLSKTNLLGNEGLTASVSVTNTGSYDGEEVIQLYIQDVVASISRPVKELKNFKKIYLMAGEKKTVKFRIDVNDLKFFNENLKYAAEPGEFRVFIGANSKDVKQASFGCCRRNKRYIISF
jgi:beta-glucosidase